MKKDLRLDPKDFTDDELKRLRRINKHMKTASKSDKKKIVKMFSEMHKDGVI